MTEIITLYSTLGTFSLVVLSLVPLVMVRYLNLI
jgi:hypothetical protein